MTAPGGGGIRIARGYVEILSKVDHNAMRRDAASAADTAGKTFSDGFSRRAGQGLKDSRHISDGLEKNFNPDEGGRRGGMFGGGIARGIGTGLKAGTGVISEGVKTAFDSVPASVKGGLALGVLAVAGPMLAGGLAAAVTGGVGIGGIVGGAMLAMRDPRIRVAANDLGEHVMSRLMQSAAPFEGVMLKAFATIGARADQLGPRFDSIFAKASRFVEPLLDGLLDGVDGFLAGVDTALGNAGPAIAAISDGMRMLGAVAGEALAIISEGSEGGGDALRDLFTVASTTILGIAHMIRFLADRYAELREVGEWLGIVDKGQSDVANSATGAAGAADIFGGSLRNVSDASSSYARRQAILNGTVEEGIEVSGDYAKMLNTLNGGARNAEEAVIAYEEAIDDATKAVKENGRTLDANTEKGRDNRRALLGIASAAEDNAAKAYDKLFTETGDVTRAQEGANRKLIEGRSRFIAMAEKMGMTKDEARKYTDQLFKIPPARNTQVNANTGAANSNINGVRGNLNRLDGQTATVTVIGRVVGNAGAVGAVAGARAVSGRAVGGQAMAGTPYWVGERGPELFFPNVTGSVVSAGQSRAAVEDVRSRPGSAPGGGVTYHFAAGSIVLDASRLRSIEDLVRMVDNIKMSARRMSAATRTAGMA